MPYISPIMIVADIGHDERPTAGGTACGASTRRTLASDRSLGTRRIELPERLLLLRLRLRLPRGCAGGPNHCDPMVLRLTLVTHVTVLLDRRSVRKLSAPTTVSMSDRLHVPSNSRFKVTVNSRITS